MSLCGVGNCANKIELTSLSWCLKMEMLLLFMLIKVETSRQEINLNCDYSHLVTTELKRREIKMLSNVNYHVIWIKLTRNTTKKMLTLNGMQFYILQYCMRMPILAITSISIVCFIRQVCCEIKKRILTIHIFFSINMLNIEVMFRETH